MADRGRVAVLGLGSFPPFPPPFSSNTSADDDPGVSGLTALKNFLEQGFDAVAFERNEYVGGLWQYNPDPKQTTVLKGRFKFRTRSDGCLGGQIERY